MIPASSKQSTVFLNHFTRFEQEVVLLSKELAVGVGGVKKYGKINFQATLVLLSSDNLQHS